jgi:hypothetical protein
VDLEGTVIVAVGFPENWSLFLHVFDGFFNLFLAHELFIIPLFSSFMSFCCQGSSAMSKHTHNSSLLS